MPQMIYAFKIEVWVFFFGWWLGFDAWTLHILCIVLINWAKLTRTKFECFNWVKL